VIDADLVVHREASDFLRSLGGMSRSPHTIRAYAGRVARFLGWCEAEGVDWRSISLTELARFKHWGRGEPAAQWRTPSGLDGQCDPHRHL
jgi:hypothetical protein